VRVLGEDLVRSTTARSRKTASVAAITGWKLDTEGHCLEQPCEPEGGVSGIRTTKVVLPGDGSCPPTLRVVPNPRVAQFARLASIGWTSPIADTSFRIYVAGRVKTSGDIGRMRSKFNGKFWWDMIEQEHQQFPGDYEAQVGQGPVTLHS
jgi:hypothetical protein